MVFGSTRLSRRDGGADHHLVEHVVLEDLRGILQRGVAQKVDFLGNFLGNALRRPLSHLDFEMQRRQYQEVPLIGIIAADGTQVSLLSQSQAQSAVIWRGDPPAPLTLHRRARCRQAANFLLGTQRRKRFGDHPLDARRTPRSSSSKPKLKPLGICVGICLLGRVALNDFLLSGIAVSGIGSSRKSKRTSPSPKPSR